MSTGKFKEARFCPVCGGSIQRDRYREEIRKKGGPVEWICLVCCIGFALSPSLRHQEAMHWMREETRGRYRPRDMEGKILADTLGNEYSSWCNNCQQHSRYLTPTGNVRCMVCEVKPPEEGKTLWEKIKLFFIRKTVYNL